MFTASIIRCRFLYVKSYKGVRAFIAVRNAHGNTQDRQNYYDVIIAGGGLVGTTLASTLGQAKKLAKKRILLLEGSALREFQLKPTYSNRVVAINNSSKCLFESLGAWQHVSAARYAPVKKLQVWDACSDAMVTFSQDDMTKDVAYIVENDVLLSAVSQVAKLADNVTILYESRIRRCELPQPGSSTDDVTVHTEDDTFHCGLLVGADGASSKVRAAMGVQYLSWGYKQMAVVATLKLSEPTQNVVAWQRFLPSGPIALLPLTDTSSSLVWSTSTEEARRLLALPQDSFVDAVNEALWKQYPRSNVVEAATHGLDKLLSSMLLVSAVNRQLQPSIADIEDGSRAAFPLGFGHATRYVAAGVALVGDAAHRVHPLAGQGVNLGFGDVSCLANILTDAIYSGHSLGSRAVLLRYETARQRHNLPTMLAIDGLHRLYNSAATPLIVLRSLGLQLTHSLPPIKKAIMEHAAI